MNIFVWTMDTPNTDEWDVWKQLKTTEINVKSIVLRVTDVNSDILNTFLKQL